MLQQVHKSAQAIKQQYLHISAICGHELLIDVGSSLSYTAFRGVHTATTSYLQQTGRERETKTGDSKAVGTKPADKNLISPHSPLLHLCGFLIILSATDVPQYCWTAQLLSL